MESQPDDRKEPRVPGANVEKRIPPPAMANTAFTAAGIRNSGVSVPVFAKLPDLEDSPLPHVNATISTRGLIVDARLALVSVAFCILYFSEL